MYRIHFANILHEQTLYIMHYANIVYQHQQCIDSKHMNMQTVLPLDCQVQGNCFNRVISLGASRDEDSLSLKVNNKSDTEGCWRKLRAELDLLKGEEDVARDKVEAPKPKRRLLDINESDDDSDGESKMDELTRF